MGVVVGRRADPDLADEIESHLEMQTEDNIRAGMSPGAARRAAALKFGGVESITERCRDQRGVPWLDGLYGDLRQSARSLARSPRLVVICALSLGLGIGLNLVLYLGVTTVYGHRPTMDAASRVVGVEPGNGNQFSYPDYEELRRGGIFEDVLAFRTTQLNLGGRDRSFPVGVLAVTPNFFDVLGVSSRAGRFFDQMEEVPEREPRVAVVTEAFGRRFLGASSDATGQTLMLSGQLYTVVGMLPADYRAVTGWVGPQVYVPISRLVLPTLDDVGSPSVSVLGRLRQTGSAGQAQQGVTALGQALEQANPEPRAGLGRPATVYPASALQFRGMPLQMQVLASLSFLLVGLVLVIACVNVAGLLLARAAGRQRELAVRVALGAGRVRVVQTMLAESFLLVVSGAALGLPLALAINRYPFSGPLTMLQDAMVPDLSLGLYAAALVVVTTLACGLIPALRATRADVISWVRQGGDRATQNLWWRHSLVVGQIALSLVLIVGTLLCVRSQMRIAGLDLGFEVGQSVVARFSLDGTQYPGQARVRLAERVVEHIEQLPGISNVGVANFVPLGGDSLVRSFHPAGRTDIPGTRPSTFSVGPGYFRALGVPHRRGRDFGPSDTPGAPPVVIVNDTFATTHFPGEDPLGRPVHTADEDEATVVGVVGDYRIDTIGEAPKSVVYYPFAQRPRGLVVHARTSILPERVVPAMERAIAEVDPGVPVDVQTLGGATAMELNMRRVGTTLMGVVGVVGLLLALLGLYGVMSYVTASRVVEVGIRLTLGASPARIRREMLRRAFGVVGAGVLIGAAASISLTPALSTFLAGVSPYDPTAFGGASLLLLACGLAAGYLPARRASRIDPARSLRLE
jgi:predicted permease